MISSSAQGPTTNVLLVRADERAETFSTIFLPVFYVGNILIPNSQSWIKFGKEKSLSLALSTWVLDV